MLFLRPTIPSLQAEGVDVAIRRADVNHPIRNNGRLFSGAVGQVSPELGASAGIQGAQHCTLGEINDPVRHGTAVRHIAVGKVAPQLDAGAGIQGVNVVVERTDINHPIGHGGRGEYYATGAVGPQIGACLGA